MKQPLKTIAIIEAPKPAEPHRAHLGASAIGNPCARANWYTFRWCKAQVFEPRMLRLFDRGQREEATLVNMLQRIPGVTVHAVDPATGKQFAYREIYACHEKAALTMVASEFSGLRAEFGAEVV